MSLHLSLRLGLGGSGGSLAFDTANGFQLIAGGFLEFIDQVNQPGWLLLLDAGGVPPPVPGVGSPIGLLLTLTKAS